MKHLLLLIITIIFLSPELSSAKNHNHTTTSGELNNAVLKQIECLIRKKSGAEFNNNINSFELNGYNVYTKTIEKKYSSRVYIESFKDINNPEKEFRMRLVIDIDGYKELAVLVYENGAYKNYHACFDKDGIMLEEDPWGKENNYSIEIFDLYNKFRNIYAQQIDQVNRYQEPQSIFLTQNL